MVKNLYKQLDGLFLFITETKNVFYKKIKLSKRKSVYGKRVFSDYQTTVLEDWFESNKEEPYATHEVKTELALKTKLSLEQVSCWMDNKRASIKKKKTTRNFRFEPKKRVVLKDFFAQNQKPNKQDIQHLMLLTGLTEKQIASWFTKERFKLNK